MHLSITRKCQMLINLHKTWISCHSLAQKMNVLYYQDRQVQTTYLACEELHNLNLVYISALFLIALQRKLFFFSNTVAGSEGQNILCLRAHSVMSAHILGLSQLESCRRHSLSGNQGSSRHLRMQRTIFQPKMSKTSRLRDPILVD